MVDYSDYCVDGVKALRPYEPGKPIAELERELGITNIIKLASNENPLGPSPKALEAIQQALSELALYPDGNAFALKKALAGYHASHAIEQSNITVGTGSDHILELIARVFLGPGRSAVASQYGFAIYNIVSQAAGAQLHLAEANTPDHSTMPYGHNLDNMAALVDDSTRVVFIANPNNPTGTWLHDEELDAFLNKIPDETIVVLDEAYFDYVKESRYPNGASLLSRYPNLIVMRTFSKAYGLAGVRVGYALASEPLTDLLNRVRLSFNPNALAQAAATAALLDRVHIKKTTELNTAELQKFTAGLHALGLETIPSVCNFVTVNMKKPGREVFQALLQEGIIVRPLDGYGLPEHLRISIGLPAQNERCLLALQKVLA